MSVLLRAVRRQPALGADVFRLEGVSVGFRRNAIEERSLKHALSALARGRGPALHQALDDVTLTVRRGEHVGVIGRNGAGKSTLLRVLARVITPQRGRVHVDGGLHVVPLLELGIGFQADLSGAENVHLAGALMGYSYQDIAAKMADIVAFAELEGFIHEPVKNYSSGMYARLAFALATDVEPEVLLVDEVFGVGDEFFMEKCVERMRRLMAAGTTTVFVSHDLDFLIGQCDRLVWLDEGRLVADGPAQVVAKAYRAARGTS
jgi:ABC-type polysaccharide/polyol phosphate transport system ATPase subunit